MGFEITSPVFEEGAYIPRKYTADGPDVSPPLQWTDPPAATKSFALICDDPDAPAGTWVHWVIWGIPPEARGLPERVPTDKRLADGSVQGTNDFRRIGYGGPAPPRGPAHRYFFKVYALDDALSLEPGATKSTLLEAMQGHILADAQLIGRYGR